MHNRPLFLGALFSLACYSIGQTFICGDVRVQVLSPTLVRIEQKGPLGFENRPTFTVVQRNWPGAKAHISESGSTAVIRFGRLEVRLPKDASHIDEAGIYGASGHELYQVPSVLPPALFFPSPGDFPKVWAIADSPRLIPPKWGATPPPADLSGPLAKTSGFDTRNDAADLYVFLPGQGGYFKFRSDFLRLTGRIPLPPRFTFGFWNSRWYPYSEKSALAAIDKYSAEKIPLDLFVLDTNWRIGGSQGYVPDAKYFPNMARFLSEAHERGVRIMFNDHPEPQYKSATDPRELGYRWAGLTSMLGIGLDVWWYDRNWITVLPEPMPGLRKEVWGDALYHDIELRFRPNVRPLIMSNVDGIDGGIRHHAPLPAAHRYPIWWTGDTPSDWGALNRGVANGVDSGVISLLPYVNEDLGGHIGIPSPELYVRFLQYGCLSPVARVHCTYKLTRYPWAFGPEAERLTRSAINFRYRLIPTLYEAANECSETGEPILRRLDLEYPQYAQAGGDKEYLLGSNLLVKPVTKGIFGNAADMAPFLHTALGSPGLNASYFVGTSLAGAPAFTRIDKDVRFDWSARSPKIGFPRTNFSVRWTGNVGSVPKTGPYRIVIESDDGCRVFLNGTEIINGWKDQPATQYSATVQLQKGRSYPIEIDYYQAGGGAVCRLGWRGPSKVKRPGATVRVWIPPGAWIDLWTGKTEVGPKTVVEHCPLWKLPLFIRQGAIELLGARTMRADAQIGNKMTAEIYPSPRNGKSTARFYEDDGISNGYLKGESTNRLIAETRIGNKLILSLSRSRGRYAGQPTNRDWVFDVHLPNDVTVASLACSSRAVRFERIAESAPPKSEDHLFGAVGGWVARIDMPSLPESWQGRIVLTLSTASSSKGGN